MKQINYVAIGLFLSVALSSCTPKMAFLNSTVAPAATGTIKVKKDNNKNYALTVDVMNLAEPQKLTPPRETYVVWMESNENSVKKLGQLMPRSKVLKGELKTTSVDKPTDIFITAEDNADVNYPNGDIVLTTKK